MWYVFPWRCFPFADSTPRAYRLKVSNAAPLFSTSAGTFRCYGNKHFSFAECQTTANALAGFGNDGPVRLFHFAAFFRHDPGSWLTVPSAQLFSDGYLAASRG